MSATNLFGRLRTPALAIAALGFVAIVVPGEIDKFHSALSSHWSVVDNPTRDRWDLTREVETALDLQPGQRVADVGAGSGYFSMRIARAVGAEGQVVATEINPWSLLAIRWHAWKREFQHVQARPGAEGSIYPGADFDRLLMLNVFAFDGCDAELNRKLLGDVRAALRPGGRAVVVHDTLRRGQPPAAVPCPDPTASELVPLLPADLQVVTQRELELNVPPEFEAGYVLVLERTSDEVVAALPLPSPPTKTNAPQSVDHAQQRGRAVASGAAGGA